MITPEIDIIIIKGAPTSGKSQTAKDLSKYFPKGVRLEVDNLRSMVISVDWTNQTEHIKILELSSSLITGFFELGFKPIIIIDTFSGDKINSYYEQIKRINGDWTISIFGLYTSEIELLNRLNKRTDDKFRDYSIAKQINEDTLKYKHHKEFQIDTTNLKSSDTAKIIYEKLLTIS